jgi:hypothetical protein
MSVPLEVARTLDDDDSSASSATRAAPTPSATSTTAETPSTSCGIGGARFAAARIDRGSAGPGVGCAVEVKGGGWLDRPPVMHPPKGCDGAAGDAVIDERRYLREQLRVPDDGS